MSTNNNIRQFNKHPRKHKAPKGNLFAVIFVIIVFFSLFLAVREMLRTRDFQSDDTYISDTFQVSNDPMQVARTYVTGQCIYYDDSDAPTTRDDIWVMYNLLGDADKHVYNLFMDLVEHRNGESYTNGIIITKEQLNQLDSEHFWCIYYAMLYDHPEFFYLTSTPDVIDCHYIEDDNYSIYFYMIKAESKEESRQIAAFDNATDRFMEDIDLSLSDEEKELAIHDKLISMVNYDYDLYARYDQEDSYNDLGFSAYGALVCNSSGVPNSAVCNGYALAFEYLCQEAGIPCCVVTGDATHIPPSPEQDNGGHAWNCVKIGDKWYEVDSTWDDIEYDDSIDLSFFESLQKDSETFSNCLHHYYNRSTAEMVDLKATDDTVFEIEGYMPYNLITDTSHVRYTDFKGTSEDMEVFRNRLIPIAE